VLAWWDHHGRHDLPWQKDRTAYRVWVAEVMLQQTQVGTVIGYFERFMQRFPTLGSLAAAELDDVLALWSGLGYYARGRNLHQAARTCRDRHAGELPDDPASLEALPGIGRSTANAIVAQAFDRRAPILDGNVKRVLARHAGIAGWPGRSATARALWSASEARTPARRAADYTQAIMDLGATLCTARNPSCTICPVARDCRARIEDRIGELPGRKPRRERPARTTTLLIVENGAGQFLLERRPPTGIWGGLWSLPAAGTVSLAEPVEQLDGPPTIVHQFSHFSLTMHFRHLRIGHDSAVGVADSQQWWFGREQALASGLPRPIRTTLEALKTI
jgi:A/G-specific adenine glycosylase